MPHNFDDSHDGDRDVLGWLQGKWKESQGSRRNQDGERWGDLDRPRSTYGKRVVQFLVGLAVVILAGVAHKYGLIDEIDDPPRPEQSAPNSSQEHGTAAVPTQRMYAQRDVRVHRWPAGDSVVVRRIKRGESVLLGERDGRKWAKVYEPDGDPIGFVYVYNENFASTPPPTDPSNRH